MTTFLHLQRRMGKGEYACKAKTQQQDLLRTGSMKPTNRHVPKTPGLNRQTTAATLESRDSKQSLLLSSDSSAKSGRPTITTEIRSDAPGKLQEREGAPDKMAGLHEEDWTKCCKIALIGAGCKHQVVPSNDYHLVQNPLPVTTLDAIIENARDLVCLELYKIRLVGSKKSFAKLSNSIEYQGKLQVFSMEH